MMVYKRSLYLSGLFLVMGLALASSVSFASSGESGHGFHVPTVVYYQVFNFGLLLVLLHMLLRKTVVAHFADRRKAFIEARTRAAAQREEAERNRKDISERLNHLTGTADQAIAEAKREAENIRQQLLAEAQQLASRLREEANRTTQYELQKAVNELRERIIDEATMAARTHLAKLGEGEREALHKEFVEKIQVVQ